MNNELQCVAITILALVLLYMVTRRAKENFEGTEQVLKLQLIPDTPDSRIKIGELYMNTGSPTPPPEPAPIVISTNDTASTTPAEKQAQATVAASNAEAEEALKKEVEKAVNQVVENATNAEGMEEKEGDGVTATGLQTVQTESRVEDTTGMNVYGSCSQEQLNAICKEAINENRIGANASAYTNLVIDKKRGTDGNKKGPLDGKFARCSPAPTIQGSDYRTREWTAERVKKVCGADSPSVASAANDWNGYYEKTTNSRCGPSHGNKQCTGERYCSVHGWCGNSDAHKSASRSSTLKGFDSPSVGGRTNETYPKTESEKVLAMMAAMNSNTPGVFDIYNKDRTGPINSSHVWTTQEWCKKNGIMKGAVFKAGDFQERAKAVNPNDTKQGVKGCYIQFPKSIASAFDYGDTMELVSYQQ